MKLEVKKRRLEIANKFIEIIAGHGRRFFHYHGRVSRLELDHYGRVWFVDSFSGKRVYTHYSGSWRGFTNGGTMRSLIVALREYVCGRKPLPIYYLGPWPDWLCGGDLWGYGTEEMEAVRAKCKALTKLTEGPLK